MRPAVLLVLIFSGGSCLLAQVRPASLEGQVVDASGNPISGATVQLRDPATSRARTGETDADGHFRLTNVPPGTYDLRAEKPGFLPYVETKLQMLVGRTVRMTIRLVAAEVRETVEVRAQRSALDPSETGNVTVVDTERIEELPVQSRNYLEFVLLSPGVIPTRGASAAHPAGAPDSGFSFSGLRPRSNVLTIDGLDNNDEYTGSSRTELSLETVQEFEVVSRGWSAENGGGSGGAISVVTKSGTNVVHGDAFVFGQWGRFNSRQPLENTGGEKPASTRYRAGGALGGPLVRDRTFYSIAAEREHAREEAASDVDPRTVSAINEALAGEPEAGVSVRSLTAGLFPTGRAETELSAKVTHQATSRDSLVLRLAETQNTERADAFNAGGLADASSRGTAATRDDAVTGSWTSILGVQATNEVHGQLARRTVDLRTADREGAGVLIPGVVEFGRPYAGNSRHRQAYAEIGDTLSIAAGPHFWRAGFDVTSLHLTGTSGYGSGGLFVFRSLETFLSSQPDSFRQVFGDQTVDARTTRYSAFLQDRWTRSTLTLDVGLRLDGQDLSDRLDISSRQLGPRLGVAWSPGPTWVLRGGAGTFADRLPFVVFERALVVDSNRAFETVVDDPSGRSPSLAGALSIYTARPGRWTPSSRQAGIGVEHLLAPDLTASVSILFAGGRHLARTVNVNLLPPVVLTPENAAALGIVDPTPQQLGRPIFSGARRDPTRADVFEVQPTASSTYRGLTVSVSRRIGSEGEWSAAYTLSRTTDDASDYDEQPQNPYALADERAPSRYDQRHRFVASARLELGDEEASDGRVGQGPGIFDHIEIAPILAIDSGRPVNPTTGFDEAWTRAYPATSRPLGRDRNSLRLPTSVNLNLRVLKYFPVKPHGRLDVVVEAFNLLDSRNVTELNPVWGSSASAAPGFGRAVGASPGRQVEFSLDLEF